MNSPLAEHESPEKALWYQEVLSLDPASRIFLPYARLLAESGRRMEAIEVLRAGLSRHPEFLDARLLLIEELHAAGQNAAAGLEAAGVIESLSQCSALWDIWSRLPGVRPDQAAMLRFFGATFKKDGPTLAPSSNSTGAPSRHCCTPPMTSASPSSRWRTSSCGI